MRLVTISGPRGSGKDTVMRALAGRISGLRRIVAHTTRTPRPGEQEGRDYHFVSDVDFDRLIAEDHWFWYGPVGPVQRFGILNDDLAISSHGSAIVTLPVGARTMRNRVEAEGGQAFLIAVFASAKERQARIRARQPGISEMEVGRLMREDPVSPRMRDYKDFNARLINRGADPEPVCQRAIKLVQSFLR